MHGIIPYLFDCWADPVAHPLLLKSSMDYFYHQNKINNDKLYKVKKDSNRLNFVFSNNNQS